VPGYYTLPAIAAALWARSHGRESVLMTESTAFDHVRVARKELLKMLVIRSLFGWAVAGGKAHVAYLRQLGFPEHRIVGRYDVVDNATISEGVSLARDGGEPPCGLTRPYFLYVGRLSEEKNVGALLESWEAYRREGGTWPLILVGDGPERERLRDRAARSIAPEEVFLAGLKSSCEVIPFYAFAGCFVLPSSREPWGLVVNEAMAAGLPVLVSNRCGCCADLVEEGSNGMTFDPHDGAAIARQLHAVEQLTEEQRRRMGQRSRERIDSYTPRAFGDSVASILEASGRQASLRTVSEAS
jgi:glycosyltransferase involved in cell wall biosynthesis